MSKSIFNTSRGINTSGNIASSEYAAVTIGSQVALGQNCQGSYTRKIETIFELGNPNLYWLGGHEEGRFDFTRLAGDGKFYSYLKVGDCGEIKNLNINSKNGTCTTSGGKLTFSGAVIESVNWQMTAGQLQISEGCSIRFATLSN